MPNIWTVVDLFIHWQQRQQQQQQQQHDERQPIIMSSLVKWHNDCWPCLDTRVAILLNCLFVDICPRFGFEMKSQYMFSWWQNLINSTLFEAEGEGRGDKWLIIFWDTLSLRWSKLMLDPFISQISSYFFIPYQLIRLTFSISWPLSYGY